MFRLVIATGLAAILASAQADVTGITVCMAVYATESEEGGPGFCAPQKGENGYVAGVVSGDDCCQVILDFETCAEQAQLSEVDDSEPIKKVVTSMLEIAKRSNLDCALPGDARFELSAAEDQVVFRFDKQGYSVFDINSIIGELESSAMTTEAANIRLDSIIGKLTVAQESLSNTLLHSRNNMERTRAENEAVLLKSRQDIEKEINRKAAALETKITTDTVALKAGTTAKLDALSASVAAQLEMYQLKHAFPNGTSDPKYRRNYELIMVEKAPYTTGLGNAGRMYYKIDFNVNNPGFWWNERRELIAGCNALSYDLKQVDGIDRALRPACDQNEHSRCNGNGVDIGNVYLSNCGCGSRPRSTHCGGMTNKMLAGAVMFNREHSHNGHSLLRHNGRDCHHEWVSYRGESNARGRYTICTSSNTNNQV